MNAFDEFTRQHRQPDLIMVSPTAYALLKVYQDFEGRNWRRLKRESRKAIERVRKEQPSDPAPFASWLPSTGEWVAA